MQAVIQKLELKKFMNKHYIKVELIDENGIKRTINKPFINDDINFRKQVFGILSACGCYDLMTLATKNPNSRKMVGYYQNGLQILENEKTEWLRFDKDKKEYTCKKTKRKTRKVFDMLASEKIYNLDKEEGSIERIVSASGAFQLFFSTKSHTTFFIAGQVYYGFGYPLTIGHDISPSDEELFAKMFTSFIVSLMKLYGINDLLKFGGETDDLPIVEITLDNNNEISSMTNPSTGMGLSISTKYDIINIYDLEKKKYL